MIKGFFAYPGSPQIISDTINAAQSILNERSPITHIRTWEEASILGHFIRTEVTREIQDADTFIADISVLNFNVAYEIGYAIGKRKKLALTRNIAHLPAYPVEAGTPTIEDVGIFDTIGYQRYENSTQLADALARLDPSRPLFLDDSYNANTPVFVVESKFKTDWMARVLSRLKVARLFYRSFDPVEQPRMSAFDAIRQVSQSYGVVVPLAQKSAPSKEVHNLRCAFVAGLADGIGKAVAILQDGDYPIPLDYRDFVIACHHPKAIDEAMADFAASVIEALQATSKPVVRETRTFLEKLDLGASSAENEFRYLGEYYLETDAFRRVTRGEIRLVVGRKGSGKSAIFFQVRDNIRRSIKHVVLDLKPDGYKLVKLKEKILSFLREGSFEHTVMAFWDYILLREIAKKVLEDDRKLHVRDNRLIEPYRRLQDVYERELGDDEGDFSERLSGVIHRVSNDYYAKFGSRTKVDLKDPEITDLLYRHNRKDLSSAIEEYLKFKKEVWILFDNLDKGWPSHGIESSDILIIRALLEATRKIERHMTKQHIDCYSVMFLRSDVFEMLIEQTPDRGKESKAMVDWTDEDMLRELLRRRLVYNLDEDPPFDTVWRSICASHVKGEESSQYLIDRSLMRPRFLIDCLSHCKSVAVNLRHDRITEEDILKGVSTFSTDVLSDIGLELRDVYPEAADVVYAFISCQRRLSEENAKRLLLEIGANEEHVGEIIELLLWYGFLGIVHSTGEEKYIYTVHHNMALLKGMRMRLRQVGVTYCINPAFWPALGIA